MTLEDEVRTRDRTQWLAALFAPEPARPALHALAAYGLELDRIVATVREPLAAEVRLQWWRDAIRNEGYGEGASVPLVDALRDGQARYAWPADTLCAMSEARLHDLYADPFEDWTAFDGYAGEVHGAPVQLGAMALGVEALGREDGLAAARTAATAAGWGGVALATAGAAEAFAARAALGHTRLPASAWREATGGDLATDLAAGRVAPRACEAVAALVRHGTAADAAMRELLPAVAGEVRAAFLPALLARSRLEAARRSPAEPRVPSAWRAQLALWREARRLRRAR
ncbi:squalene/phytoene synthase family protein [Acuticoccus sp.]|uniref:squalene/phytoene synthase family protein n=1 Tax=Acuticoccus sp. TaxID=1904378 RepID=UPI003B52F08B